jgi:regulator of replication initiation timing
MDCAIQLVSSDDEVRKETIEAVSEFKNQSLTTQAKKGEQLQAMMPAIKKSFGMMVNEICELSAENSVLKDKIGDYDVKWLNASTKKLLIDTTEEAKKQQFLERMRRQLKQ